MNFQNEKIIEEMNRELAESEKKLATPDMPPPLRPSESSADVSYNAFLTMTELHYVGIRITAVLD